MKTILGEIVLATAVALSFSAAAFAAASDGLDPVSPREAALPMIRAFDYQLDKELVVHNWVLCVSEPFAETIARARTGSLEEALAAYANLAATKSCGRFSELRVILHRAVYQSTPDVGHDARVFSAAVNISGVWADAFLGSMAAWRTTSGSRPLNAFRMSLP